jgi:hypothetical protein
MRQLMHDRRARFGLTEHRMAELLDEAVDTLWRIQRTQPGEGPRDFRSSMPIPLRDVHMGYGWHRARPSVAPPSAAAIDRLDLVLRCVAAALEPDARLLVWMRAYGVRWKRIERQFGRGRNALWRQWLIALHRMCSYAQSKSYARALGRQKSVQHIDEKEASSVTRSAGRAHAAAPSVPGT